LVVFNAKLAKPQTLVVIPEEAHETLNAITAEGQGAVIAYP
jgi:hypothetical protein